jgi:hypothetical protein
MWRTKETVDPDADWRDLAIGARQILKEARPESKEDARLLVDAVSRRDNVKIRFLLERLEAADKKWQHKTRWRRRATFVLYFAAGFVISRFVALYLLELLG